MSWDEMDNELQRNGLTGQLEPGGGGPDYQPPKRKSPWKTQIIGALVGLVVFIVVAGIFYLLYGRFR